MQMLLNQKKPGAVDVLYELTTKELEVKNYNAMNAMVKVANLDLTIGLYFNMELRR